MNKYTIAIAKCNLNYNLVRRLVFAILENTTSCFPKARKIALFSRGYILEAHEICSIAGAYGKFHNSFSTRDP